MQMNFYMPPPASYGGKVHMGKHGLRGNRYEVFPVLSRVDNIGVEGGIHTDVVSKASMRLQQVRHISEYATPHEFTEASIDEAEATPGCPGVGEFLYGIDTVQSMCWPPARRERAQQEAYRQHEALWKGQALLEQLTACFNQLLYSGANGTAGKMCNGTATDLVVSSAASNFSTALHVTDEDADLQDTSSSASSTVTELVAVNALHGLTKVYYTAYHLGAYNEGGIRGMARAALKFSKQLLTIEPTHVGALQVAAEISGLRMGLEEGAGGVLVMELGGSPGSTGSGVVASGGGGELESSARYFQQLTATLAKAHAKQVAGVSVASGTDKTQQVQALATALAEGRVGFGIALKGLHAYLNENELPAGTSQVEVRDQEAKKEWVKQAVEKQFQLAIKVLPSMAEAHAHLGAALAGLKSDLGGAIQSYKRAIAIKPDLAEAHSNLGVAYHTLAGNGGADAIEVLQQAASSYSLAASITPTSTSQANINANVNLGAVLIAQKRYWEARGVLHKAVTLQPMHKAASTTLEQLDAWLNKAKATTAGGAS
jgi:tetratricopeptide (TPR) repeat protein